MTHKENMRELSATLPSSPKSFNALALALLTLTAIPYLHVFANQITNWDDGLYILNNPHIKNLSFQNLKNIFSTSHAGNYHPLTLVSMAIDYQIGGTHAWPYQLTNLFLHVANTWMLYFFVKALLSLRIAQASGNALTALIVATLFGLHTFQVESVVWISERKNVLYAFFFIASLILYIKYLNTRSYWLYVLSVVIFIFSLLSKGMAVPLSICVLLIDYFAARNILSKRVILEKMPYLFLSLGFGIIAVLVQQSSNAISIEMDLSWLGRISIASYGFMQYLIKLFFPFHLSAFYPYPAKLSYQHYGSLALVVIILGLGWLFFRNNKVVLFGALFFIANISIVIQLLPVGGSIMADRYMYVASIGLFFIVAHYCNILLRKNAFSKNVILTLLALYGIMLSIKTYQRVGVWKDSLTLWNNVLKNHADNNKTAFQNRGNTLYDLGRYSEALQDYKSVLKIDSNNAKAYIGLGLVELAMKDDKKAMADFNTSLSIDKSYEGFLNRAVLKMNQADYISALDDLDKAQMADPLRTATFINKGYIFFQLGNYAKALKNYDYVHHLDPQNSKAYLGLAQVKQAMKDYPGAMYDLGEALSLDPSYEGFLDRAVLKIELQDFQGALSDLDKAAQINPSGSEIFINRGVIGLKLGNINNAVEEFNKAIDIDPSNFQTYNYCAIAEINKGDFNNAINNLDKSIKLRPNAPAYYYRAIAKMESGQKLEGCNDLKQSIAMGYKSVQENILQACK